jgi:hypothetical protein
MRSSLTLAMTALPLLSTAQFLLPPPTEADPNTIQDCTYWRVAGANDTCDTLRAAGADVLEITLEELVAYVSVTS